MKWFKHQADAHSDAKLEKVLMRYGSEGYGLYWYCIELIAGKVSGENITFELEHDAEVLGYRLKIDSLRVEEIMRYMISLGLFELSGESITCMRIAASLDERWTKSEDLREVIRKTSEGLKTLPRPSTLDKNRADKKREDNIPYQLVVDHYNKELGDGIGLPKVKELTDKRKRDIRKAWKYKPNKSNTPEYWQKYFAYMRENCEWIKPDFPRGEKHRNWKATFDYCIRHDTWVKVREGSI